MNQFLQSQRRNGTTHLIRGLLLLLIFLLLLFDLLLGGLRRASSLLDRSRGGFPVIKDINKFPIGFIAEYTYVSLAGSAGVSSDFAGSAGAASSFAGSSAAAGAYIEQ